MTLNYNIKCVQIFNNNIFCVGDNGLVAKSSNNGNNWVYLNFDSSKQFKSCFVSPASKIFLAGLNGAIYYSTDLGISWIQVSNGSKNGLNKVSFYDANNGIIVGNSGTILKTTDAGNSWVTKQISYSEDLNDAFFVSLDTIYICGNDGLILSSINGGNNWHKQNSNIHENFKSLTFFDNKHGIASGSNGRMVVTSKGEFENQGGTYGPLFVRKDNVEKMNFTLAQNYPNPFNPSTKINFSLPENSKVCLKVYDVLGKEVAVLLNDNKPKGTYSLTFNGSDLASGVYFYKLVVYDNMNNSVKFTATRKMLLVK